DGVIPFAWAFTAAVRWVDGIKDNPTIRRPDAHMTCTARLADSHVFVVKIPDLSDRGAAINVDEPHLTRGQLDVRVRAFLCNQLGGSAGASRHLRALARSQFDIVNRRAEGNVAQRQRVADEDIGFGACDDRHADFQSDWLKNVPSFAVRIAQQSNESRSIRIVLDRFDLRRYSDLVAAKIDDAIVLFVSTAAMTHRQLAIVVPSV